MSESLVMVGAEADLEWAAMQRWPLAALAHELVRLSIARTSLDALRYQGMALYGLARQYNEAGRVLVEIGTGNGYSTAMLALGAPQARIISYEIDAERWAGARDTLAPFRNVEVVNMDARAVDPALLRGVSMVFVDGNHEEGMTDDLLWYERLLPGGLMMVHDVSIMSAQHFPHVVRGVLLFMERYGFSQPDVALMEPLRGMVGFYRRGDA